MPSTRLNIDKIEALKPDLVLTFSDLQAHIAADLIHRALDVHALNQRSVAGILDMIRTVGAMADASERTLQLVGRSRHRFFEPAEMWRVPGPESAPVEPPLDSAEVRYPTQLAPRRRRQRVGAMVAGTSTLLRRPRLPRLPVSRSSIPAIAVLKYL